MKATYLFSAMAAMLTLLIAAIVIFFIVNIIGTHRSVVTPRSVETPVTVQQDTTYGSAIRFYHDSARQVGCWVLTEIGGYQMSISCLPDSQYYAR